MCIFVKKEIRAKEETEINGPSWAEVSIIKKYVLYHVQMYIFTNNETLISEPLWLNEYPS